MRFIYYLTTIGLILLLFFSHLILGLHFASPFLSNFDPIKAPVTFFQNNQHELLFIVLSVYILGIITNVMMYLTINSHDSYKFSFDKNLLLKLYYLNSTFIVFLFSSIIISSILTNEKNLSNAIPLTILLLSCLHQILMTKITKIDTANRINFIYICFLLFTFALIFCINLYRNI